MTWCRPCPHHGIQYHGLLNRPILKSLIECSFLYHAKYICFNFVIHRVLVRNAIRAVGPKTASWYTETYSLSLRSRALLNALLRTKQCISPCGYPKLSTILQTPPRSLDGAILSWHPPITKASASPPGPSLGKTQKLCKRSQLQSKGHWWYPMASKGIRVSNPATIKGDLRLILGPHAVHHTFSVICRRG